MDRDSRTQSIWQQDIQPVAPSTGLINDKLYDVLIVGAGITGLTTGVLLQAAGKSCVIADTGHIGFGTSSATTAHLNTVLDTHYYDMLRKFGVREAVLMARGATEAIALVNENVEKYHIPCDFMFCDAYLYSETDEQTEYLEHIREGMQDVGLAARYADAIPVPVPFRRALVTPGQARFNPGTYLSWMAKAFDQAGGVLLDHAMVDHGNVEDHENYLVATAGGHRIRARQMVYATHIPPGLNQLHFECTAYRSYVLAVQLEEGDYPDALVYDLRDPYDYFRTALVDGRKYLLVGGFDHKTGHDENEEQALADLESYVRQYYRVRSVDYRWSSQYYEPADGLPYIGLLPGADKTFVATGYSGAGMTLGTMAARILFELIVHGESAYGTTLSPSRKKLLAGFQQFLSKNAGVIKYFVGDRSGVDKVKELAAIPEGEGRVVEYHDKKLAVYKDAGGKISALNPVCTHAGCIVQWNNAEKSWDCPCHGSRYNTRGEVLNGPATWPLEKVPLHAAEEQV
jgi:glycine/D-amino acid oxidase-like deaminating enzyme/nitrite reductase/ring-hydroxylating ferredoxin subunit